MNQVIMWSRIMVALCCVYSGALGQSEWASVVDPVSGVEFTLYGGDVVWTWERAYNHCVSVGQRLAVIDNSPKQEAVNRFTYKGHAWIGGRRSPDVTWRWISGEEYEYETRYGYLFNNTGPRCGAVGRLSSPSVLPSECVVSVSLPAVCQRLAQGASKRYWVTDTTFVSWNDARVSCLDQGGDLAHPSSQEPIQGWKQQMVDLIADPLYQAWIGLSRHSWSWVTGDHITLQGPPLTTSSQPRPAQPTVTLPGADNPHQTEGGLSTTGTAGQAPDVAAVYRMLWVTVGVCVILVVTIIIIITFCLIKNRRLKKAGSAAMATVPVVTPHAAVQHEPSSRDNEGSYSNLRTSQIESRDPGPYERLDDGAHYDFVGDPETGVEANGGRRIYQNVD